MDLAGAPLDRPPGHQWAGFISIPPYGWEVFLQAHSTEHVLYVDYLKVTSPASAVLADYLLHGAGPSLRGRLYRHGPPGIAPATLTRPRIQDWYRRMLNWHAFTRTCPLLRRAFRWAHRVSLSHLHDEFHLYRTGVRHRQKKKKQKNNATAQHPPQRCTLVPALFHRFDSITDWTRRPRISARRSSSAQATRKPPE